MMIKSIVSLQKKNKKGKFWPHHLILEFLWNLLAQVIWGQLVLIWYMMKTFFSMYLRHRKVIFGHIPAVNNISSWITRHCGFKVSPAASNNLFRGYPISYHGIWGWSRLLLHGGWSHSLKTLFRERFRDNRQKRRLLKFTVLMQFSISGVIAQAGRGGEEDSPNELLHTPIVRNFGVQCCFGFIDMRKWL